MMRTLSLIAAFTLTTGCLSQTRTGPSKCELEIYGDDPATYCVENVASDTDFTVVVIDFDPWTWDEAMTEDWELSFLDLSGTTRNEEQNYIACEVDQVNHWVCTPGWAVDAAVALLWLGDTDADDVLDILVGAPGNTDGDGTGAAYLLLGGGM